MMCATWVLSVPTSLPSWPRQPPLLIARSASQIPQPLRCNRHTKLPHKYMQFDLLLSASW